MSRSFLKKSFKFIFTLLVEFIYYFLWAHFAHMTLKALYIWFIAWESYKYPALDSMFYFVMAVGTGVFLLIDKIFVIDPLREREKQAKLKGGDTN